MVQGLGLHVLPMPEAWVRFLVRQLDPTLPQLRVCTQQRISKIPLAATKTRRSQMHGQTDGCPNERTDRCMDRQMRVQMHGQTYACPDLWTDRQMGVQEAEDRW